MSVKLKFIILISQPKHMLWVLQSDGSFEYPKLMIKPKDKKIISFTHNFIAYLDQCQHKK